MPALLRQRAAEIDVRRGKVGRRRHCVLVAGNRLLETPLILVSVSLIEMRLPGRVPLQPAARTQVLSEIAQRIREFRLQRQGVEPRAYGFASLALRGQREPQVVASRRIGAVAGKRPGYEHDGLRRVSTLQRDDAQKMQRVDVLRILRERFAIERFGFAQSPGAVMLQAELNPSVGCGHPSSVRICAQSFGNRLSFPGMSSSRKA